MKRRFNPAKLAFLILIIGPLAIFVFGMVVMWLWNNALVPVLHVSTVTFWQALGILVLSKILFSSFSGGRGRDRHHSRLSWKERIWQKWDSMTPEEQEKFRQRWREHSWKNSGSEPSTGGEQVYPGA
ncbi:MAG: hypothetical protein FJY20_06575 [Bacteroidetes bacterium]|nr:hypothetical protein [Bacteroidota bacterium]